MKGVIVIGKVSLVPSVICRFISSTVNVMFLLKSSIMSVMLKLTFTTESVRLNTSVGGANALADDVDA